MALEKRNPFVQAHDPEGDCPSCGKAIGQDDISVAADVALCRSCGARHRFSELVHGLAHFKLDVNNPPAGATYEQSIEGDRISATTRSAIAFFLVPFVLVWSVTSVGTIYGRQVANGEFSVAQSLFGIPFLLGAVVVGSMAAMHAFGRVTVTRSGGSGTVFTGVGSIGWTRRFSWTDVRAIREYNSPHGSRGRRPATLIEIELATGSAEPKHLRFGSLLSDNRRRFIIGVMRSFLSRR